MRDGLREADLNMDFEFIPYWSQTIAPVPGPDTYASFYVDRKRRRVVLVYLNNTDSAEPVALKLDWKALGLDAGRARAASLAHRHLGEENWAKVEGDVLTFSCTPRDYRLLVLQPK